MDRLKKLPIFFSSENPRAKNPAVDRALHQAPVKPKTKLKIRVNTPTNL